MPITKFEDFIVWQKSKLLAKLIYKLFGESRDFGFKDQIQRSAISIMNNIAEGYERNSKKEFVRFLYISKASAAEVRSMLYLAIDFNYISQQDYTDCFQLINDIMNLLGGLIKNIKNK